MAAYECKAPGLKDGTHISFIQLFSPICHLALGGYVTSDPFVPLIVFY